MRSLTAHGWETDQPKSATAPGTFRSYDNLVPTGLKRYQSQGHDHHITFSCYGRRPYLSNDEARTTFLSTLEQLRTRHRFYVYGGWPTHPLTLRTKLRVPHPCAALSRMGGSTTGARTLREPQPRTSRMGGFTTISRTFPRK